MAELFPEIFKARDARVSACGRYRWWLQRCWYGGENGTYPWVGFIMLNPSTADALKDDATIRTCTGWAKQHGFSGVAVVNLFCYRATDPRELKAAAVPVGGLADEMILRVFEECTPVIAAWGTHGDFMGRDRAVMELLAREGKRVQCLGKTKRGFPRHPLYLSYSAALEPFGLGDVPQRKGSEKIVTLTGDVGRVVGGDLGMDGGAA